jgi:imidazolonepropionase-like amidohydrolase
MKSKCSLFRPLIFLIGLLLWSSPVAAWQAQRVVIHSVTLIDGESDRTFENAAVIFQEGKIISVTHGQIPQIPEDALVIDGTGKFLIPGLWDMHAHLSYWGEDALGMLVNAGVTSIRELGGDPNEIEEWKQGIDDGILLGPSMIWCGPYVEGLEAEDEYRLKVSSEDEARAAVHTLKKRGVDFIKIQPLISAGLVAALVDEGKKLDMTVVGHVPQGLSAVSASDLGLRSIEHMSPYLRLSDAEIQEVIEVFLKNGTWVSPAMYSMIAPIEVRGDDPSKDARIQHAYVIFKRFFDAGVSLLLGANFAY